MMSKNYADTIFGWENTHTKKQQGRTGKGGVCKPTRLPDCGFVISSRTSAQACTEVNTKLWLA